MLENDPYMVYPRMIVARGASRAFGSEMPNTSDSGLKGAPCQALPIAKGEENELCTRFVQGWGSDDTTGRKLIREWGTVELNCLISITLSVGIY